MNPDIALLLLLLLLLYYYYYQEHVILNLVVHVVTELAHIKLNIFCLCFYMYNQTTLVFFLHLHNFIFSTNFYTGNVYQIKMKFLVYREEIGLLLYL